MTNRPAPPMPPSAYFDEEGRPIDTLVVNRLALCTGRLLHPQPLDAACMLIQHDAGPCQVFEVIVFKRLLRLVIRPASRG
jgi:hypothetical protein